MHWLPLFGLSKCALGTSEPVHRQQMVGTGINRSRWRPWFLLGSSLIATFPMIAGAQSTCSKGCAGACTGFQSSECSTPTGCIGSTVCVVSTGTTLCNTLGAQVPCAECGAGGHRTCSPFGTVGACQPRQPSAETCNGCDDDGNGHIDDGLSGACTLPNGCAGVATCTNGVFRCELSQGSTRPCQECVNGTMECKANGTFGTCQPDIAREEACNLCDDDRDGVVDNVRPSSCVMPAGCTGSTTCVSGTTKCEPNNNSVKYGCTACGDGGFQQCLEGGGLSACRRTFISLVENNCDGCDDDGDNRIDNAPGGADYSLVALCQGPQGPCVGSSHRCTPTGWDACRVGVEVCDGNDNDCDGVIDNGSVCRHDDVTCRCIPLTCRDVPYVGSRFPDGCGGRISCR